MQKLLNALEGVDSRLLVLGAVLLCAVGFAFVKATGALSGTQIAPAYQNTPAQAFVPPSSVTLVSPAYLQQTRLPDDDYVAVVSTTRTIVNGVANLTVTSPQLQKAGMSAVTARATLAALNANSADLSGRQVSVDPNFTVTPGSNADTAEVVANVQYSVSPSGQPPESAALSFSYSRSATGTWALQAAQSNVQSTAPGASGSSGVAAN